MNERDFFDREGFGQWLKSERVEAGYKSASAFAEAIYEMTGLYVTKDILYKLETGRQDVTVMQLLAFSLTLYSNYGDDRLWLAAESFIGDDRRTFEHAAMYVMSEQSTESSRHNIDLFKKRSEVLNTPEDEIAAGVRAIEMFIEDSEHTKSKAASLMPDDEMDDILETWHRHFDNNPLVGRWLFNELHGSYK